MTGHDLTHDEPMTDAQSRAEMHAEFAAAGTAALFDYLVGLVGAGRMALVDAYESFVQQTEELDTIRHRKENAK